MLDVQTSARAGAPRVLAGMPASRPQDAVFPNSPWVFKTCQTKPSYRPSAELIALSEWIGRIQKLAKKEFGYGTVWIAGGSSRTVLDHVYFGKPLKMRDLDLFFVAGKREEEATAWRLAEGIEKAGIARFERKKIRPKSRVNPHLPPGKASNQQLGYKAGYGIHLVHDTFPILSLSIFHEAKDLELNGIMNVDKIMIRLEDGQSLAGFVKNVLGTTPYWKLAGDGVIVDQHEGYLAWLEKKPEILNWLSLSVEPPMKSIRILRSYAKCGYSALPETIQTQFRELVQTAEEPKDPFEMMRSFLKILSDKLVAPQLAMLASIGTLEFISPELQKSLAGLSADEILARIQEGIIDQRGQESATFPHPMRVLEVLTQEMSPRARGFLLKRAAEAYPTTFA